MRSTLSLRSLMLLLVLALFAGACASDDAEETADDTATESTDVAADSASICDADGLVAAVESGPDEGTLAGMADDPVGTAATSNPVLTTLVQAVVAANLVDTLNSAPELTVFAPTDCAFAQFDQETLAAALADPTGLLTTVLTYHVLGERVEADDLGGEYTTLQGETLTVDADMVVNQATIQVPGIQTANATVYLIDSVMVPPSAGGGTAMADDAMAEGDAVDSATICDADGLVAAVQGGTAEGTLEGMADDPVATAASSNPILTTLVAAVTAADLGDALNSAPELTVFAPTDCAFAALDPATLEAALADPTGLLVQVLGLHVIPGQRISSADLSGEYTNFLDTITTVEGGVVNGTATIVVPDIQTANATVHLIDSVLLPS